MSARESERACRRSGGGRAAARRGASGARARAAGAPIASRAGARGSRSGAGAAKAGGGGAGGRPAAPTGSGRGSAAVAAAAAESTARRRQEMRDPAARHRVTRRLRAACSRSFGACTPARGPALRGRCSAGGREHGLGREVRGRGCDGPASAFGPGAVCVGADPPTQSPPCPVRREHSHQPGRACGGAGAASSGGWHCGAAPLTM